MWHVNRVVLPSRVSCAIKLRKEARKHAINPFVIMEIAVARVEQNNYNLWWPRLAAALTHQRDKLDLNFPYRTRNYL